MVSQGAGPSTPLTSTYSNTSAKDFRIIPSLGSKATSFHYGLPKYAPTRLHHLPNTIRGVPNLFLKDESTRFELPSFKILGASYAIHQTLLSHLSLPDTASIDDISLAAQQQGLTLVTASAGNWGRAVARTASLYGINVNVYVPFHTSENTYELIRSESVPGSGGVVECVRLPLEKGSYDDSLEVVQNVIAKDPKRLLLTMDTSWEGYETFPRAVTDGYETMLTEVSTQLRDAAQQGAREATHVVISVGVGSWAHAVVMYYSSLPAGMSRPTIITVEPEDASCLLSSLHLEENTLVRTGNTILAGMNCGKVSKIAWPVLKNGVDVAVAVSDLEAHTVVEEMEFLGLSVGPCGAATLAGFRKALREGEVIVDADSCVVLLSTEGRRAYVVPDAPASYPVPRP